MTDPDDCFRGDHRIYKYPLLLESGSQKVEMPFGAICRHVHEQNDRPVLWCEVNPAAPTVINTFGVYATGEDVPASAVYTGTVHVGWTVRHVFLLRDNDGPADG